MTEYSSSEAKSTFGLTKADSLAVPRYKSCWTFWMLENTGVGIKELLVAPNV